MSHDEWYPWGNEAEYRMAHFEAEQYEQRAIYYSNDDHKADSLRYLMAGNSLAQTGHFYGPGIHIRIVPPKTFRLGKRLRCAWRAVKFVMSERWEVR